MILLVWLHRFVDAGECPGDFEEDLHGFCEWNAFPVRLSISVTSSVDGSRHCLSKFEHFRPSLAQHH